MSSQSKRLRIGIGILTGLLATAAVAGFVLLVLAVHT
ncbi:MAG: hypothetical protein BMS9Abin17_0252 [Acidimicrobiia bacterium]|nr:MAG: hypothetical protein BMS9Abin17_0252 [Acidimicrobiia bacterium]